MKKMLLFVFGAVVCFFCGCVSLDDMKKDAEKGDETAQMLLGLKYFYGSRDVQFIQYDDARRYFGKAARRENPLACYYLGEIYEKGLGQVDVDNSLAKVYYKRAADTMKDLPSQLRRHGYLALGKMYDFGRGVKKDESKARYYYKRAYDSEVLGSSALIADFLNRTRGTLAAGELKHILDDAIANGEPQAEYMYARAVEKTNPKLAQTLLRKSADGNYSPAVIALAEFSRNKMLIRSANEKAASNGYGPAFYELALGENNDEKRYDLLKKSADRGFLAAYEALGNHYENRKEWNRAVVFNYFADRIRNNGFASPASIRLERIVGLSLPVSSIWQSRDIADGAEIGTNIDYFIRGQRAGIVNIRENYSKYIAENPEKSYVNMDYVRLFHENMPMVMAGDIFKIYYDNMHGAVGNDFYLNYAVAAGYAGQGKVQFYAADNINLKGRYSVKWQLAKMLLKANGLALMGNSADAYELLVANYNSKLSEAERCFIVDFVNGNCNMLLKDIKKLSAALNIPQEKFVVYKEMKKQDFYDLEKRSDTHLVTIPAEPKFQKNK